MIQYRQEVRGCGGAWKPCAGEKFQRNEENIMKLGIKTCTLTLPYEEALDFCVQQEIPLLEIATGNWSAAPHIDLDTVVSDKGARDRWYGEITARGLTLDSLNCAGNPLGYAHDMDVTEKTFRLAGELGVKKIVMMSGLPAGCKGDKTPVWITTSWPPETQDVLKYQWEEVAIPEWIRLVKLAEECGIEKIALENHPCQLVYNVETCLKLREAVGPMIGMNLDPSHMFWQSGDPMAAARVLGAAGALYHVHGKDARLERYMVDPNGVLDTKTIDDFARRAWNFVAVGSGHSEQWWSEFLSVVRMADYDDVVSLEMEDLTMSMMDGHLYSLDILKRAMVLNH